MRKHFDGWGRVILGYMDMVRWYAGDPESLSVIRRLPPFRYAVLPDVEISLDIDSPELVTVSLVWPGGNNVRKVSADPRFINSLRKLYASPEVTWRHRRAENRIVWKRRGRVVPCAWSNYYPVRYGEG